MSDYWFEEQREQSLIKARIVSKYFKQWAGVMLGTIRKYDRQSQKLAYIDLFAGPGRYNDQSKSTPILVLEAILANPELSSRVVTLFNDKDSKNIESLMTAISELPNIDQLKHEPMLFNEEVGDEIAQWFSQQRMIPTFFFVDPWGYKGLSQNLVSSIIKDWGCDCVFFFNYNRINMGVNNNIIEPHLLSLFGKNQLAQIRERIVNATPDYRESVIIQALCYAFKENGQKFVLPFRFRNSEGTRTTHHLVFITKGFRGYEIMKEIMAEESSDSQDGVANFEYNPQDARYKQGSLFDMLSRPLDDLQDMLLQEYSGQTISFTLLYENHSVDKPFIKKHYKSVLWRLFDDGKITAVKPNGKSPRKGTFADDLLITFGGAI